MCIYGVDKNINKEAEKAMEPESQAKDGNEEQEDNLLLLENMIPPSLLKDSSGGKSCCIFRIPQNLARANEKAYEPKIIAIGPYHRSDSSVKKQFKMMEEHKQRFLKIFISKTQKKGVNLSELVNVASGLEQKIRDSYSECLILNRQKLAEVMILDGCFILTLLLVVSRVIRYTKQDDPIFMLRWILPTLRSDLLLLENQVPLFLLQDLLKASKLAPSISLNEMVFKFYKFTIIRPDEFWEKHKDLEANHILDLIRKTFIPFPSPQAQCCINIMPEKSKTEKQSEATETSSPPPLLFPNLTLSHFLNPIVSIIKLKVQAKGSSTHRPFLNLIVSASKLQLRGIKFKPKENVDTPLDISFNNGLLEIPVLVFDDFITSLLINCVALEQFQMEYTSHFTSYVAFMGCLVGSGNDADFLSEKRIIENYFGTSEEISLFFKNIGKDMTFSIRNSFLADVFEGVNEYTSKGYHVHWAGFKYTHFKSPWTFMSSLAALVLLILTIVQSFFAAYAYFRPLKNK